MNEMANQIEQPIEDLLGLISVGDQNLHVSLLNLPDVVNFFHRLDQHALAIRKNLATIRFPRNDSAFVTLSLLAVAHGQMQNAFVTFLRRQSYDAQLLFRPSVESAIFAYQIYADPKLGSVWVNRFDDPKPFFKAFKGSAKPPSDMPFGKDLKAHLDKLNDYRSHPNIGYLAGRMRRNENRLEMIYFDSDETFFPAVLEFVSVCLKILAVFRHIFSRHIEAFVADTEPEFQSFGEQLNVLRKRRLGGD